jgi:hypothetical protein
MTETMVMEEHMFNNPTGFNKFVTENGRVINTYNKLDSYCQNDSLITKKAIIEF